MYKVYFGENECEIFETYDDATKWVHEDYTKFAEECESGLYGIEDFEERLNYTIVKYSEEVLCIKVKTEVTLKTTVGLG